MSRIVTERNSKLLVGMAVWLSFFAVSLAVAPIPGVNESHYFTKAKHFWNPAWCERDLFLTSYPAHRVFYQTLGWLTQWFDLPTVAFLGRVLGTGLLAASWTSLTSRWRANGLLAAWLFLGLQAIGNFSGEWLIGGLESKTFAYAFVFWALAALLDHRLLTAAVCSGVATSFHPIIGLWHVLAVSVTTLCHRFLISNLKRHVPDSTDMTNGATSSQRSPQDTVRVSLRDHIAAFVLFLACAAPGLLPAIEMLRIADARSSVTANYIQVFYRLKHHLDPMDFGAANYLGYGLLILLWLGVLFVLRHKGKLTGSDHWWIGYVIATAVFASVGLAIGFGPRPAETMWGYRWRMGLLKFYPFRMFDLLLPVAVAVSLSRFAAISCDETKPSKLTLWVRVMWFVAVCGLGWSVAKGPLAEPQFPWTHSARADWKDACRWIAQNTPENAMFITPLESDSFKWHAQRAEFANFKDCPQDAKSIVEWNRRLRLLNRWGEAGFADQRYSTDELLDLCRQTHAEFALARRRVPYEADLIYSNNTFNVFRLPQSPKTP